VTDILPQQLLLLELLVMSGDIAVSDKNGDDTILHRTMDECERKGWVSVKRFGAGFNKASVTDRGRALARQKLGTV